ncbi:MAG: hypothetical protein MI742_06540 [Desulfobacterales bacterium]|nr:hypothetical protein [Desulfobacterales bacterium]
MSQIKATKAFAKLLAYTLGVDPYEFGLIPDEAGYVKIKELLKGLNEEEGWRHIKESHIKEVALTLSPSPIEIEEKRVRAVDRSRLKMPEYVAEVPGELYAAIRKRAWPRVHERGIAYPDEALIRLTTTKAFAQKLGHRIDGSPVILTIHTPIAEGEGIVFMKAANHLFLAHEIPAKALSGPALPKPDDPKQLAKKKKAASKKPEKVVTPGSFFPSAEALSSASKPSTKKGQRDKESWKENKKRFRRDKNRNR